MPDKGLRLLHNTGRDMPVHSIIHTHRHLVGFPCSCHQETNCKSLIDLKQCQAQMLFDILPGMQFCWSPTDPKQCALVTDSGQLLLGRLGEPLQAIEAYSAVTSASWSLDGQLLAVGSGRHVHVYNAQRHTACFSTQVESQVCLAYLHQVGA